MKSDLYPSPAFVRYQPPSTPEPVSKYVVPSPPKRSPVPLPVEVAVQVIPQPVVVPPGDWWPCFVCGVERLCPHREVGLVAWMKSSG